ncbi:MAG: diacylglycerol kinase [Gammaproteobacteria bacterium]|nr:MAG: diacylglycerol kinase [Gammaproteobacteria bacterium]
MNNIQKPKTGFSRLFAAAKYSIKGLKFTIRDEEAFRLEIYVSIILIPLAIYLSKTKIELILMIAVIFLVWIAELLNTAIEAVVDKTGEDIHPLAEKAKDVGSAAVFTAMVLLAFVWFVILV